MTRAPGPVRLRPGPVPREPRPAVFLDRDGVLVEARVETDGVARAARQIEELVVPGDVAPALGRLREAGDALVGVTNQPEVARGGLSLDAVRAIDEHLLTVLGLDDVYICAHDRADACSCRKPQPGMMLTAARDLNLDLARSWLIGDRWVDIAAGAAAGVRTILLERPYSWNETSEGPPPRDVVPTHVEATMSGCVGLILA